MYWVLLIVMLSVVILNILMMNGILLSVSIMVILMLSNILLSVSILGTLC
jgi:hypothetical protein